MAVKKEFTVACTLTGDDSEAGKYEETVLASLREHIAVILSMPLYMVVKPELSWVDDDE